MIDRYPTCDNCGSHRCACHYCPECGELISREECGACEERAERESVDA